jgi:putative ABC transport system permease protein
MRRRLAQLIVRLAAWFVPQNRREDWREMWEGDLWQLSREKEDRKPGQLQFAAGAFPAALRELKADWSAMSLAADVRQGWKRLKASSNHTAVAVLLVTVGISANTSIFSIANAVMLRVPPHVAHSERLVQIGRQKADGSFDNLSYPNYADLRDQTAAVYSGMAAYARLTAIVETGQNARPLSIHEVTANLFEILGTLPELGRSLSRQDEEERIPAVVLSDGFWRQEFGGDSRVIGRSLKVDGTVFTIVGVAPPGFIGADVTGPAPAAWVPLLSYEALTPNSTRIQQRGYSWLWVVGRLRPGVSLDQARAATKAVHRNLAAEHGDGGSFGPEIGVIGGVGLRPDAREEAQRVTMFMMGIVSLVLLTACANLGGLLVAQAARRERDMTIRAALGASHLRLVRELLAEQLLCALAGAAAAWILTWWTARAVQSLLPYNLAVEMTPDARVFLFAVALAAVTSLLFGILPARRSARVDVATGLRGAIGRRSRGLQTWLPSFQLAVSLTLIIGAGLLIRSIKEARSADPGFAVDTVTAVQMNTELLRRRSPNEAAQVIEQIVEAAKKLPGVKAVAAASHIPVAMPQRTRSVWLDDAGFAPDADPPVVVMNFVSPDYFDAMNIRLTRGRLFSGTDNSTAIVSESTARKLWPDRDAIGRRLRLGSEAEVVGVVSDVRLRSLQDPDAMAVYLPFPTNTQSDMSVIVRSERSNSNTLAAVMQIVRASNPEVAIVRAGAIRDLLGRSYAETRMFAILLGIFSAAASILAAAGVYVVLATWVSQQQKELSIRLAVGAMPSDLSGLVIRRCLKTAIPGVTLGLAGAAILSKLLERLLFGVTAYDPVTYFVGVIVMFAVSLLAASMPARRAIRANPMITLKGA